MIVASTHAYKISRDIRPVDSYRIQDEGFRPACSAARHGRVHIVESLAAANMVAFKLDASFPLARPLSRGDSYIEN